MIRLRSLLAAALLSLAIPLPAPAQQSGITDPRVRILAPPLNPGSPSGAVEAPPPLVEAPLTQPDRPARPGKAHSHLHPGDDARRRDERTLQDQLSAERAADLEAQRRSEAEQHVLRNEQFLQSQIRQQHESDMLRWQMDAERARAQGMPLPVLPPGTPAGTMPILPPPSMQVIPR